MKNFKIKITERLEKICDTEANSLDEAIDIVRNKYSNEKIILYPEDFVEVIFEEYKEEGVD